MLRAFEMKAWWNIIYQPAYWFPVYLQGQTGKFFVEALTSSDLFPFDPAIWRLGDWRLVDSNSGGLISRYRLCAGGAWACAYATRCLL